MPWLFVPPGARLNIKIPYYRYKNSHYKDKTVSRPSYFHNENPTPGKVVLYWDGPLVISRNSPDYVGETCPRLPWGRICITCAPYQYKDRLSKYDSHVKDKTVARRSYLWHWDPYAGKTCLYWDGPLPSPFTIENGRYRYIFVFNWQKTGHKGSTICDMKNWFAS